MSVSMTCPDCGLTRNMPVWERERRKTSRCNVCSGKYYRMEKNPNWRGGKYVTGDGYYEIVLPEDSAYLGMAHKTRRSIREHRFVMAKHLGRTLESWEVVHHKNGDKLDNHIDNLELMTNASHLVVTLLQREVNTLKKKVEVLENQLKDKGV